MPEIRYQHILLPFSPSPSQAFRTHVTTFSNALVFTASFISLAIRLPLSEFPDEKGRITRLARDAPELCDDFF